MAKIEDLLLEFELEGNKHVENVSKFFYLP